MANNKNTDEDDLAEVISMGLNKAGLQSFFLGKEPTPADITDFVSTGSSILDLAISNKPNGGIVCGRITELMGLEGSCKSLLSAHMMASVQKEGGVAVLLDTENAINQEFFNAVGLRMDKMIYRQPESCEEVFETIEKIIELVRKKANNDKKVIIVVDSMTAAPTKKEIEGDYDRTGYATDKAILMSQNLKKIIQMIGKNKIAVVMTSQLRMKMQVQAFADPYTTSGGKALGFYSSTRIKLSVKQKITNKDKQVIGARIQAQIIKNRIAAPWRVVEFSIFFDRGIDDIASQLQYLKDNEIVIQKGPYAHYIDNNGEEHTFNSSTWAELITTHPELSKEIYQKMCDKMITSYKSTNLSIEDGSAELSNSDEE